MPPRPSVALEALKSTGVASPQLSPAQSSSATMCSAAAAAGVVGCPVATACPCRWPHPDEAEAEAAAEVVVAAGVEAGVAVPVPGAVLPMTGVIAVVVIGVTVWFGAAATGCTK